MAGVIQAERMPLFKPGLSNHTRYKSIFLIIISIFWGIVSHGKATEKEIWAKDNSESLMPKSSDFPELLNFGGPDGYGYYFYDSQDSAANAPHYRWVEIASIGDSANFYEDDQITNSIAIGFPFYFYGQNFTTFRICSNGWISFNSTTPSYQNHPIPTADEPNNLLAVFWDDLVQDSGMAYYYSNNTDSCIIEWRHYHHYNGAGNYTFEVIITHDNSIHFQYLQLNGILDSHTIGVENSTGAIGLQYVYNSYLDESGRSIYFGNRPPHYASLDVMPSSVRSPGVRGLVGSAFTPSIRFTNAGTVTETFDGRVTISHNGELYNQVRRVNSLRSDSSLQVSFPSFTPTDTGSFQIVAISQLATDLLPRNDTIRSSYFAYGAMISLTFETNSGSFLGNHDWQWGTATRGPGTAHSGTKLWGTILTGNYTVGPLLSSLYSDTLFLSDSAVLTFWQWHNTEALFDGGNVKISTDDGITWTILTPEGGYDGVLSNAFENPMGGQPAFFGISPGWIMETFDLSSYSGTTAIIRFDFGSDNSGVSTGWYIDDFIVVDAGLARTGRISGVVRDDSARVIRGALVQAGRRSRAADSLGRYSMEIIPGTYAVTASAPYHNSITSSGIIVYASDTTTLDFALTTPDLEVDTAAIDTSLRQEQVIEITRHISNNGSGPLNFNIRINNERVIPKRGRGKLNSNGSNNSDDAPQIADFGDELFIFDPQTSTQDDGCVGVEFDGKYFWVTGRHGVDEFHKLHKFSASGELIESFEQNTRSVWGWRDLAFDGRYLYASDENGLAVIDTATGQKIDTLHAPSSIPLPLRALAYDPRNDHFWAANFSSNIIEFDRTGQTIRSFPNDRHIYGLAWDDASIDGPWLWVFSQDSIPPLKISQFDPGNGVYTDVTFRAIDHNGGDPDLAGGACFTTEWNQSKGILFCMVMGQTDPFNILDRVQGYEITPVRRWLRVDPTSGTIAPGSSFDLSISLDFSDSLFTLDSLYLGAITILNNGPNAPTIPITVGLLSDVRDEQLGLPREFSLGQNYPNPFNSITIINFSLPRESAVKLEVFNILGQKIANLIDTPLRAGYYSINWDASDVASGIYFYQLSTGGPAKVGKMMLLK
jgi:hypothetical protein